MGVIAIAQITIRDATDITVSAVAPVSPVVDQLWLDSSVSPNQLKRWNGSEWETVNEYIFDSGNMLMNTTDNDTTVTDTVIFSPGNIDLSNQKEDWVTFRVHMDITSGEWEPQLVVRSTSVVLGQSTLLGDFVIGAQNNNIVHHGVIDEDGWQTITIPIAHTTAPYEVTAQLVRTSQSGELTYHSPKLELGDKATPWDYSESDLRGSGENLFNDTSSLETTATTETLLGYYFKTNSPTNIMTFRGCIETSDSWTVSLRVVRIDRIIVDEEEQEEEVLLMQKTEAVDVHNPWTQITIEVPYDEVFVRAILTPANAQCTATYSQIKLEYGGEATPWSSSIGDLENSIDAVDALANEVKETLTGAQQEIDGINGKITNLVTKTELNAFDQVIQQTYTKVEQTDQMISQQVGNLQRRIETNMTLDTAGLHLRQSSNSQYEALLDSTSLSFVSRTDSNNVIASFGAEGAWADRLRSNQTLSVGTDSEGWFDFTMLDRGMAEKWRSGDSYTDSDYPLCILKHPTDTFGDTSVTLEVVAGPRQNISYAWQRGFGGSWSSAPGVANSSSYTVSLTEPGNVLYEYRCVVSYIVSGQTAESVQSNGACVGSTTAPVAYDVIVNGSTLTVLDTGATSYQWYNGTTALSNATSQSYNTNNTSGSYRCVVVSSNGTYNVSKTVEVS